MLLEGFDYDLWANERWLLALDRFRDRERAEAVMAHILRALRSWLERCADPETVPAETGELLGDFRNVTLAWKSFLETSDPKAFVSYTNMAGEPFFNELADIARHVVNHGTYHRGQLRGLAMAEGLDDFPETDFIRYCRERTV